MVNLEHLKEQHLAFCTEFSDVLQHKDVSLLTCTDIAVLATCGK
jgi:hypothetical protein